MMHAIRPEVATENPDAAVWLIKGYQPGPAAVGVLATAKGGARPYPMVPSMGLLHTALGDRTRRLHQGRGGRRQGAGRRQGGLRRRRQQAGFLQ